MRKLVLALVALSLLGITPALAQQDYTPVKIAELARDSVVSIDASSISFGSVYTGGGFGELGRQSRVLTDKITGFVYTSNGYIITDGRDLARDAFITVTLADGTELEGKVAEVDADYGVGIIKVNPKEPLKPVKYVAELYDDETGRYPYAQGDTVVAIGYSGGYGGTVTAGIVSAVRNMRNTSQVLVPNSIQTDAVINGGNEGCPLFNSRGEVIGVHMRRAQSGRGFLQRTTFFTPMWLVKRVADELITNHEKTRPEPEFKAWHPWLGIKPFAGTRSPITGGIRQVGDDLKMFTDWPHEYWDVGLWIDRVWTDSPAAEFGIKDRDILFSVTVLHPKDKAGKEHEIVHPYQYIKTVEQLEVMVSTSKKGDIFDFGIYRNGKVFNRQVELRTRPDSFAFDSFGAGTFETINNYV